MPSQSFPEYSSSVPAARRYVLDVLEGQPSETCQVAAVLVSELATNAVRHAGGSFEVTVERTAPDGPLWIGVTDAASGLPVLLTLPPTAENGRGLRLVSTLADRWGVRRRRGTAEKTIWFELGSAAGEQAER